MNVAIDYDGVISANYQHYFQLAFDFVRNGHKVFIITGANRERGKFIKNLYFPNNTLILRPKKFVSTHKNIGKWKKRMLIKYNINLWFDNEVKIYEKAGVDFSDLKTTIIRI